MLNKKEYVQYNLENKENIITYKNRLTLNLYSYQQLIANLININNKKNKKILLNWGTGVGKSITGLVATLNIIKNINKLNHISNNSDSEYDIDNIVSNRVYIFGYSDQAFKNDLLAYPKFGIVTIDDLKILKKYKADGQIFAYKNKRMELERRISSGLKNGKYEFIGYRKLVKLMFVPVSVGDHIEISEETDIVKLLETKKYKLNMDFIKNLNNSLIICDEIHNVYNSKTKNSFGVALQRLFDIINAKVILMTATPLNNNPAEIIDLLNLLLSPEERNGKLLLREDYFDDNNQLLPKALERIRDFCNGKISYVVNKDPKVFPKQKFIGEEIKNVPYLKFIRVPFTDLQKQTYDAFYATTLPKDSIYLTDICIPNLKPGQDKKIGIFKTRDIQRLDNNLYQSIGLQIKEDKIQGDILHKDNLHKISNKYKSMIENVIELLKKRRGKIFIYHTYVIMSGVHLIEDILLKNGFIDDYHGENEYTRCLYCSVEKKHHDNNDHIFKAVKFLSVRGNKQKKENRRSLLKFNEISNLSGENYMIIIGSKIMKESYSLKSTRNVLVMSRPDNISTLVQIIGRASRKKSHILLPVNEHNVDIYIYSNKDQYDEKMYIKKIKDHQVIKKIENAFQMNAIDAYNNHPIIFKNFEKKKNKFVSLFEIEYFDRPKPLGKYDETSFNIYFYRVEIINIMSAIKYLFTNKSPIWKYDELFDYIKLKVFNGVNMKYINKSTYNVALNNLVWNDKIASIYTLKSYDNTFFMEFDKTIIKNNTSYTIIKMHKYFMLVPIVKENLSYHPHVSIDIHNRTVKHENIIDIDLSYKNDKEKQTLLESILPYNEKVTVFINKWKSSSLHEMEQCQYDFNNTFHIKMIEDIISYYFKYLTVGISKQSLNNNKVYKIFNQNHDFAIKMLQYYKLRNAIVWADSLANNLSYAHHYNKFLKKPFLLDSGDVNGGDVNGGDVNGGNNEESFGDDYFNKITKSYVSYSNKKYSAYAKNNEKNKKNIVDSFKNWINKDILNFIDSFDYSENKARKYDRSIIPIGHILKSHTVKLFEENEWKENIKFSIFTSNMIENGFIIGYDEWDKSKSSVQFKLRSANQTKRTDARFNERGMVATSKSKKYLLDISKKLNIMDIKTDFENNKNNDIINVICSKIRIKLIYNELHERFIKKSNVKWFYFTHEL